MDCYVLTGGLSSRMGQSKADLFLARVAAAAGTVFDRVVAVERAGGQQRQIPTIFEDAHEGQAAVRVARRTSRSRLRCSSTGFAP